MSKTTEFGKEIRKLRIDKNMTLLNMANKIGMSIAHLSAVETGRRNIHPVLVNKLLSVFTLDDERKEILSTLAYECNKSIKLNLSNTTHQCRQMTTAFGRRFQSLSTDDIKSIQKILKNYD